MITDPVLATQILRSKAVDKLRFMYSFLDVVNTFTQPSAVPPCCLSLAETQSWRLPYYAGHKRRQAWDASVSEMVYCFMTCVS